MRARGLGLAAPTAAFTGFGTDWFDYDNDGWLDLFVANGAVNIVEAQRGQPSPVPDEEPAVPQHRRTDGSRRPAPPAGPAFDRAEVGRGAAFGDVDNDGDVDIVVTNNNGPVRLLLNQAGARAITGCRCALEQAAGQPVRVRRLDRRRARRPADALAPRAHRRQLPVRERRARALRPRLVSRRRPPSSCSGPTASASAGPASPATGW